jgi:hypothetical protein
MDNDKLPQEFDASTINDLDTARLALRWALERVHKMGEELSQAREEAGKSTRQKAELEEESRQKDETVKRWRETIKIWEASMQDQHRLEIQMREELRKEVTREEDAHVKEERLQLTMQIDALKREIVTRESVIGSLRREIIDAVKVTRQEAERELQSALTHQEKALEETKMSLLERLKIQAESIRAKEKDLENQQRLLDEQIKAKEADFRRRYERDVEELIRNNREALTREDQALSEKFEQKIVQLEARFRQKEEGLEEHRRRLEDAQARRVQELEKIYQHKNEEEWGRLQERLEAERQHDSQHQRQGG